MTAPPQRIALLHYAGPPGIGGVEATIAAHAWELAGLGYTVRILAGSGSTLDPQIETVTHPLLGSRGPQLEALARELAAGTVSARFHALVDELAAWLAVQLDDIDVLVVHNVLTLHKNVAFTAALARVSAAGQPRLVAWCHDFAWQDPLYIPELHPGWPWDLLRTPWPHTRYVAVSKDRQTSLAALLGIDVAAVTVVTPGVDPARLLGLGDEALSLIATYNLLEADPLLVLPARVTRRKNIELGVAIAAALAQQGRPARLVVTGPPGPHNPGNAAYLAELQALRAQLGVPESVLFLHQAYRDADGKPQPVSDALVGDLLRLADGLLFPSRAEGFGIPMLEAGLVGMPIFCSDIAPFREIAGAAALYFALDEPPATIAARIGTALDAPALAFKRRVRHTATWAAIVRQAVVPLLTQPW